MSYERKYVSNLVPRNPAILTVLLVIVAVVNSAVRSHLYYYDEAS
jgi:hypothetical protein